MHTAALDLLDRKHALQAVKREVQEEAGLLNLPLWGRSHGRWAEVARASS
jgi:8-oxo-dGTP pyrophosphatase MutT (NUDIX family)